MIVNRAKMLIHSPTYMQHKLNLGTCGPTQCAREKPQQIDSCMRKKPTDNLASKLHKIVHTELCARKQ